jgi:2,3-bisphosphoglycerate-independent phosphoglycerate mutase
VNLAVRDGSLLQNEALLGAFRRAAERNGAVHLLGLVSRGGVHSHIDHLRALLDLAGREGMEERTWIHAFTDGRDVSPHAAVADLATLPAGRIATIVGRYYAMDRDSRWERTERALDAILAGTGEDASDPVAAVRASYDRGVTDEFVEPIVLAGRPRLDPAADSAIFFNFRPDRGRQLSHRLLERGVDLTTMTRYAEDIPTPVAFPEQGEAHARRGSLHGGAPAHAAETEVRPRHVLFNGATRRRRRPACSSPRRGRAELRPRRRCRSRASRRGGRARRRGYGFCVVNFANPDMVGHTGVIAAVVRAVETVDTCLGEVVEATHRAGGVCLVTADHGNAEKLLEDDGVSPHTAHTTNPVPLVVTQAGATVRPEGELSDLAPTVLDLLGLEPPGAMTGASLVDPENR